MDPSDNGSVRSIRMGPAMAGPSGLAAERLLAGLLRPWFDPRQLALIPELVRPNVLTAMKVIKGM